MNMETKIFERIYSLFSRAYLKERRCHFIDYCISHNAIVTVNLHECHNQQYIVLVNDRNLLSQYSPRNGSILRNYKWRKSGTLHSERQEVETARKLSEIPVSSIQ